MHGTKEEEEILNCSLASIKKHRNCSCLSENRDGYYGNESQSEAAALFLGFPVPVQVKQ